MATLISAYTPDESKKASVLTGKPNRVTVEVEDNIDREFWRDLLSNLCPEKELHFNCYQTIVKGKDVVLAKGKARIIKLADALNDYHIGCVDSDYDWLQDSGLNIESRKSSLRTYQAKDGSIKQLLSRNYRYKGQTNLYDKIAHDVSKIW